MKKKRQVLATLQFIHFYKHALQQPSFNFTVYTMATTGTVLLWSIWMEAPPETPMAAPTKEMPMEMPVEDNGETCDLAEVETCDGRRH